ncbi:TRAP transporter substrate-binding protein DctP [Marinobacterium mangrovicola]|uniref:TRAP-type C4-dicarboxylate transport system substrate-binding protein n=1 Tax=Marinobacterium mangrovicola TaxID=1476959 RepID=A0A4R1GAH1_9GAMM|nr:TRAP transporter substrate-binding protein DctP [Marinobacterium mangrovicola]TCK02629.1 TRAP-type C4-dicarboxylate transport system substrate-binding protein [Marinobacterium mangrovicola]
MKSKGFSLKALAAAVATAAMLTSTGANALTLKLATDSGTKGSPAGNALEKWGKLIEEKSGGEIETRVFYQNELGGQQEVFDLHVAGDVDVMLNWPMTSYDKRIGVIYTPYMTLSWDEALKAYSPGGWVNNMLGGIWSDIGLKFFGPWPEGFNGVGSRGKYALNIEDAEGLKVRTMTVFPAPQTMQALGYQTAAIDWGEVYTALQTGVVDGEAGNVIYWDYEYFRDSLDYYVQTKHFFMTGVLSMNLDTWDSMSEEEQKVVAEAAEEIMNDQFKAAKEQDEYYIAKAQEEGMEYFEPTDEQIREFAKAAREKVWPQMEEEIGSEIMETIRANASPL